MSKVNTLLHRSRSSSHHGLSTESLVNQISNRPRAVSQGSSPNSTMGDTFTLILDALRLQHTMAQIISSFKLSRNLCKELTLQLDACDEFVEELQSNYDLERSLLESQRYFIAFMEYVEVLNRAWEFLLILKEKGALTRLKNRDRYRKATRVLALEIGKGVQLLQRLQSSAAAHNVNGKDSDGKALLAVPAGSKDNEEGAFHTMVTISGTLKQLRSRVFADGENLLLLNEFGQPKESENHKILRRQIRRQLDSHPRLGGGFIVYKASYNGLLVAERVYKDIDSNFIKRIQQEISCWFQVRSHRHTSWIHGLWIEGNSLGIISDYYELGNLHELIRDLPEDLPMDCVTQHRWTMGLLDTICELHENNITLGGVHPRELFLSHENTLHLSTFESLPDRILGDYKEEYLPYAAPELTSFNYTAAKELDIYSLGVVLGSIWSSSLPTYHSVKYRTLDQVTQGILPDWSTKLPLGLQPIILRCLEVDPQLRPTAQQLRDELKEQLAELVSNKQELEDDDLVEPHSITMSSGYSFSSPHTTKYDTLGSLSPTLLDQMRSMTLSSTPKFQSTQLTSPLNMINNELSEEGRSLISVDSSSNNSAISYDESSSDEIIAPHQGITLKEALSFHQSENYAQAYAYFQYLAKVEGCPSAHYHLGIYHYTGKPNLLPPNIPQALHHLELAAHKQHGDAWDLLGLHQLDPDTPRNFDKAFIYFQQAATLLSPAGCYHLAQCYRNGHGVAQDLDLGFYTLQLAASLGYAPAMTMLEQELVSPSCNSNSLNHNKFSKVIEEETLELVTAASAT